MTVGGKNISELCDMSVVDALDFIENLALSERDQVIAEAILKEIRSRLGFLRNVGLEYLTLSRAAATLSGGESQRIRLATNIGSSLMGVLYILDEPSIGLHQRDNHKLLATLKRLRDLGNTVIVVEHDEDTMLEADHIVDIGPGAGIHGGNVIYSGDVQGILQCPESVTGQYLSGARYDPRAGKAPGGQRQEDHDRRREAEQPEECDGRHPARQIRLRHRRVRLGQVVADQRDSVQEARGRAQRRADGAGRAPGDPRHRKSRQGHPDQPVADRPHAALEPGDLYRRVHRHPRRCTPARRRRRCAASAPGRFSFNIKGGRCEACQGDGIIKIEMHFLPDVYVACDVCKGKRYNRETLEVKYKGKSIYDVLEMTVEEGLEFFKDLPKIERKLRTLYDVGLGYIKIGQPATTLSGGEAQRVKLATELSRRPTGKTVYILDEPTTGLHIADVHRLIDVLQKLVDTGNTVIVIEHNLDLIKTADHIIDLGPEGGDKGGTVIAESTPEQVAATPGSYTGEYIRMMLERDKKRREQDR